MHTFGARRWAIAGGRIPSESRGHEPARTSNDHLAILNPGQRPAAVRITIFYADRDPAGPYTLEVQGQRLRTVRFNDLIDPLPVPLDTDFGATIESDVPIVVHFGRLDTGIGPASQSLAAYPQP